MATNEVQITLSACTGCRSHARINITSYQEVEHFDEIHMIYRIHCGECCTTPSGYESPFATISGDRDVAVKQWNRNILELRQEELEYEHARQQHEDGFNAVYSFDSESCV